MRHASAGALAFSLSPLMSDFQLPEAYEAATDTNLLAAEHPVPFSLLARIKLWLSLVFGFGAECYDTKPAQVCKASNRTLARRSSKIPMARRADRLALHMLRRYGLKRCQQWLYNRTLTGRVGWCFGRFSWRGVSRRVFSRQVGLRLALTPGAAPLRPD